MSDSSKQSSQIIPLDLIGSLVKEKKFKEALAEIREKERLKGIDRFSCEWGWLSFLTSKALRGVGKCEEALKKAQEALKILKNTQENERISEIQYNLGIIYSDLGDLRNAELQFQDAASTYRRIEDKKGIVKAYNALSRICFIKARYDLAIEYLNDGLEYCEEIQDQELAATMTGNLGTIYMITDRWEKARQNLLKSLELNKLCKNEGNVCRSYLSLGYLSTLLREFPRGEEYLKEAYRIIYENSFAREAAIYHEYSGELAFMRGEWEVAHQHYLKAIELGEQLAPKSSIISQAYRLLAELQVERGEHQKAQVSCEESLLASKRIGERLEEAITYRILGRIHSQNGHPAEVKRNLAKATSLLEDIGVRFHLAKTYLEMGKNNCFSSWEKMKFLGRAEDLASQLDTPYYLACVHVAFAELFFEKGELNETLSFLNKAKCVFERSCEKADLEALSDLEKKMQVKTPVHQSFFVNSSIGSPDSHFGPISGGTNSHLSSDMNHTVHTFADFVTQDKTTLEILESVGQIKDMDITVMLEGETGTGKDLLAKVIHHTSIRKDNRFVVVNCSALPETLFESELFGYKKGSFTGAVADKRGLLDEAMGGTLYLDEIGEVPLSVQVKLLRAIEEKEFVRIGEVKPRKVDFRVIAATNRDLDELVREGRFRSDLFYRLSAIRLKLPPLKEKKGDIPLLVKHFLKKYYPCMLKPYPQGEDHPPKPAVPTLDPRIMELFLKYDWPGNIRELENEVKRLLISSNGEGELSFELLARSLEKFTNGKPSQPTSLLSQIDQYEKEQIEKALTKSNGVKTKAARLLNIDESLLRYKMKKYNIISP
jgi:DNA-binding NtrC family response regulator/tetratricopeptide (TPR) repeat protein